MIHFLTRLEDSSPKKVVLTEDNLDDFLIPIDSEVCPNQTPGSLPTPQQPPTNPPSTLLPFLLLLLFEVFFFLLL